MGVIQKYKQQQRQVRVQTSETNFSKGMYYTEVPLAEGYNKTLINLEIDSGTGKLSPRKGMQSQGVAKPITVSDTVYTAGLNQVVDSNVIFVPRAENPQTTERILETIVYNTGDATIPDNKGKLVAITNSVDTPSQDFNTINLGVDTENLKLSPNPYAVLRPTQHGKFCSHNLFFRKPVGTFAFNKSYYTFLNVYENPGQIYAATKIENLADTENHNFVLGQLAQIAEEEPWTLTNINDFFDNFSTGTPGKYYKIFNATIENWIQRTIGRYVCFTNGLNKISDTGGIAFSNFFKHNIPFKLDLSINIRIYYADYMQNSTANEDYRIYLHQVFSGIPYTYNLEIPSKGITVPITFTFTCPQDGYLNVIVSDTTVDGYTSQPDIIKGDIGEGRDASYIIFFYEQQLIPSTQYTILYYSPDFKLTTFSGTEEEFLQFFNTIDWSTTESLLCYTKIGADIQEDELLVDSSQEHRPGGVLYSDKFYTCKIKPKQMNPTEAASWGYNMLLKDPYDFVCETTATNNITILGVLPYNNLGEIILTPRKNQEITLKGFYRAPVEYHSDTENKKFYTTTKQKIKTYTPITSEERAAGRISWIKYYVSDNQGGYRQAGVNDFASNTDFKSDVDYYIYTESDAATHSSISNLDLTNYNYGDWWYVIDEDAYYIVAPVVPQGQSIAEKQVVFWGKTKPEASVQLNPINTAEEDPIHVRWQIRHMGASDWIDVKNEEILLSEIYDETTGFAPFTVTTTLPSDEVLVKLTISDPSDTASGEEYVLSTNTIGLSLVSDELANTLNLNAKKFDLSKCTGMCEWEQRLVLWGVPNALNTIFISDVNNPSFFPYPNNIDTFTDPIRAVYNYGNELLVLTTSELYRLSWDATGTGWTHTLVQRNLHITESDARLACIVKNMFFFKSGEYYYMMVPKSTSSTSRNAIAGDTAIAPIYKPIAQLLDNFHSEIYNLAKIITDDSTLPDFTDQLVNFFSYVDNTKVIVNYVYDTSTTNKTAYFNVQLIYDTDIRTWTLRTFETPNMLYPSHKDAIQQDKFISTIPITNTTTSTKFYGLQTYKLENYSDTAIASLTTDGTIYTQLPFEHTFKNYQYFDTGNREINTDLKKRFREFQIKIKNTSLLNLGFYTAFLIDGSVRRDLQSYTPRFITDDSTGENVLVVERTLNKDAFNLTYNTTRIERVLITQRMLQDDGELTPTTLSEALDPDRWILNQSAFPGRTHWKIRMPLAGKGYTPRAIILSTNECEYELLGDCWVYRTMNSR